MSGRNLKIRITVGRDGHNPGATDNVSNASEPAYRPGKPPLAKMLLAGITCLAVVSAAWISLSDRDDPQATPLLAAAAAAAKQTTKPSESLASNESVAATAPQHVATGAIGASENANAAMASPNKQPATSNAIPGENTGQPKTQQHEQPTKAKTKLNTVADKKTTKIVKASAQPGRITRAVLTSAIVHREPVDKLNKSVTAPDKPKPLFYFTEIVDMKGSTLTHRWRHEGKVVADTKFRIDSDHYRVFSNKQMHAESKGNWQIEVLDQNGRTLQTAHFTYQ